MRTKTMLVATLFAAATTTFVSCNNEGDTTKPAIKLSEPEDGEEFPRGGMMCVEMDLSDNEALASFKINIHNNFNGHDHAKSIVKHGDEGDDYNTDTENAFSYNATSEELEEDIRGLKNTHKHIHVPIPETAAYGDYHLMVYCYDEAGNESYVARSIAITEDAVDHEHGDHDHDHQ